MTDRLICVFMTKAYRALQTAELVLASGDADAAVNRAFNARENAILAASLRAGVPESDLPRTHTGLNTVLWESLVKPGKFDREVARLLSRVETLRIGADYRGEEIQPSTAKDALADAKTFVGIVEKRFGLDRVPKHELAAKVQRREKDHDFER